MTDEELKALEDKERQVRESSANLAKGVRIAKNIADLQKQDESLQKKISGYIHEPKSDAGTIKRFIEAPFSNLNVIDAIHQANAKQDAGVQEYIETLAKAHAKNVRDNIATMFSGKDYMGERKNYKNILNQAGMKNDDLTADWVKKTSWLPNTPTLLGLTGDIGSDPMNAVPVTPIFNAVGKIIKLGAEVASKSPKIEKGIEALRRNFNIFYDIEKTMPASEVAEFKKLFQEASITKNFDALRSFGQKATSGVSDAASGFADPKIAETKRAIENLASSVAGAKTKYVDLLAKQYEETKISFNALFTKESGHGISGKWMAGSRLNEKYASAPLLSLPVEAKRQVMESLEQWTHIIANNPQAQTYKKFAQELLPNLNKTTLKNLESKQLAEPTELNKLVATAKKQFDDLIAQKDAAQKYLESLVNPVEYLKITPKNTLKITPNTQPKAYSDIIDEALRVEAPGFVGKTLDFTSGIFKKLMSYSPIFQTRNLIGGAIQGVSEGSTFKSYWDALGLIRSKGAKNPGLFSELQKGGALSQPGMFEQAAGEGGIFRSPGNFAQFSEALNRTSLVIADMNKGIPIMDSLSHSMKTFYQYDEKFLTNFEKLIMKRLDPFYAFDKGQMLYMPKALAENKNWYNIAAKLKEGTKPESERDNPWLVPAYRKDMFSLGSFGNSGAQVEDFLRLANLDWKAAYSKTAPAIKAIVEGSLDYNIFSGKQISKDNKAGQYANLPEPIRKLLGYDQDSNTVNPWMKWGAGVAAGPLMKPILNSVDPKKDGWSVVTSAREYDTSEKNMLKQDRMNRRSEANGGFWANNRFSGNDLGFGPTSAGASTTTPALTKFQEYVAKWEKTYGAGAFGKEYKVGAQDNNVSMMFANQMLRWGKDRADALKYQGDIAQGDELSHRQTLANIAAENKFYLRDRKDADQALLDAQIKHDKTRVRKAGEGSPFSDSELKNYVTGGFSPYQIAFNKEKERFVSSNSKLAETWRAAGDKSPESIKRAAEAERVSAQASGRSVEWLEKMYAAIKAKEDHALSELEAKRRIAYSNILSNMADAEMSAYGKIEMNRQAAQQKYRGSDDYKYAKARNDYEEIKLAESAIDAKFAQQKRDQLTKDAKAEMEQIEKYAKGKAENIIAALKEIYDRGGKSIDEFYKERLKAQSDQQNTKASAAISIAQASMQSAVENGKPTLEGKDVDYSIAPMKGKFVSFDVMQNFTKSFEDILKTSKTIEEFSQRVNDLAPDSKNIEVNIHIGDKTKEIVQAAIAKLEALKSILSNPNLDPREAVQVMEDALKLMSTQFKGIDVSGMREAMKNLASAASDTAKNITDASSDSTQATITFNKGITEINAYAESMKAQVYSQTGLRTLGLRSITDKSAKFGYSTSPYAPEGYDANAQALKSSLDVADTEASGWFQKNTNQAGDELKFRDKGVEQSDSGYLAQIEEDLRRHEENKANISAAGKVKLEALQNTYAATVIKSEGMIALNEQKVMQQRIQIAGDMASMLGQTASMIYEASGKKSKEAFYVMKAIAMAEAMIKGTQTIISCMAAGASVGGPAAPAVSAVFGGIAAAMVGAQIGIIASQTISGPTGKAKGGPIEGGSGTKDDVPIMAMKDEYVIKQSSARKYGLNFLNALNEGLIPASVLNFNIPAGPSPTYGKTHFDDGGSIAARSPMQNTNKQSEQSVQIVNVIDPQLLDKYLASNTGQKTLVNVLAANRYELQQIMR